MLELEGKYNTAKVFTDCAEPSAISQIKHLLNQEFVSGSKIRIMPDTHAGKGCTIGTTMTILDKIVPNLVGVDIGCGMETALLADKRVNLQQLDKAIHNYIPSGFSVRKKPHHHNDEIDLTTLRCAKHVDLERAHLSIGTLGGGNHFIELGKDDEDRLYLVIHSGSRNLGKQVCEYYQNTAADNLKKQFQETKLEFEIAKLKTKLKTEKVDRVLAYVEGELFGDYLHDMAIVQHYADLNRKAIVEELAKRVKFKVMKQFTTIHNYIDLDLLILRKGAISAQSGEQVLIPMNMRDGSLLCIGKGNEEWNYSAPHGAGRLMSRSEAKASITMKQYEAAMQGIYSSTINKKTIDEAPFAYKPMAQIIENIGETVDIVKIIKPLYNFKAADEK